MLNHIIAASVFFHFTSFMGSKSSFFETIVKFIYYFFVPTTVIAPSLNNRSLSLSETATGVFLLDSLKIEWWYMVIFRTGYMKYNTFLTQLH